MTRRFQRDYWPTTGWRSSAADAQGMDPDLLSKLKVYARDSQPQITALVVVRHGYVVFEEYYGGFGEDSYFSLYSITKSVLSALIGNAVRQRAIRDLDQRLLEFFPEYAAAAADPRMQTITLRHMLSMTSGFDEAASDVEILWRSDDVVGAALERPMAHDPGERFFYDEVSTHLLSVLLTRLTGISAAAFAHTALFRPLGIWADERVRFLWERAPEALHRWHESGRWASDGLPWTIDRHNHNTGGFGLHMTARELAKFGYLYVNGGAWDGAQLIPPDFVEESTRRQNGGGPPVGRPHGYLWWIPEPHRAFFAAGLGGQTLHVVPGLDLVTVFTTLSAARAAEHRGQVLEHFVIPAVRDR